MVTVYTPGVWRRLASFCVALAIVCIGTQAFAATVNGSWVNPTEREDGSALDPTEIQVTRFEWGTCLNGTEFGSFIGAVDAQDDATSISVSGVDIGLKCYRVKTFDQQGLESVYSNVVAFTLINSPPKPPVLNTVVRVAYEFRENWRGMPKLVNVGTVELGTPCGQRLGGVRNGRYAELSPDSVTITKQKKYKGGTLYGQCG